MINIRLLLMLKKLIIANPSSGTDTEYTMYNSPEDWEKLQWTESVKIDIGLYPRD